MAVASWHDAEYEHRTMKVEVTEDLDRALAAVLAVRTPLGHPTLTVTHDEDNALTVATDGSRAMLVHFIGSDGDYRNSVGGAAQGNAFVFDYEGHWSEAAPETVVTLDAARDALGHISTDRHADTVGCPVRPDLDTHGQDNLRSASRLMRFRSEEPSVVARWSWPSARIRP